MLFSGVVYRGADHAGKDPNMPNCWDFPSGKKCCSFASSGLPFLPWMSIRMGPSSSSCILTPPNNSGVSLMARFMENGWLEVIIDMSIAQMDQMNEVRKHS